VQTGVVTSTDMSEFGPEIYDVIRLTWTWSSGYCGTVRRSRSWRRSRWGPSPPVRA